MTRSALGDGLVTGVAVHGGPKHQASSLSIDMLAEGRPVRTAGPRASASLEIVPGNAVLYQMSSYSIDVRFCAHTAQRFEAARLRLPLLQR